MSRRITLVNLSDAVVDSKSDAELLGGKGKNLRKLCAIQGIHTKPGRVLTSVAYEAFVGPLIQGELAQLEPLLSDTKQHKEQIELLLAEIRKKIEAVNLEDIEAELGFTEEGKHYAVRSSATAEDGTTASFSGKFSTELHIQKSDIAENIKKVWASIFTLSNIEYCQSRSVDFKELKMAVVIQEMSHPIAAGTIFTSDTKLEIDVAPGLGEAAVRGDKPVDRIVLSADGTIKIVTETAKKSTRLAYDETAKAVVEKKLEEHETDKLSLTPAQIAELNRQVQIVKAAYADAEFGIDVEFSLDADDEIYILQAREVTVAPVAAFQIDYATAKQEKKPTDPCVGTGSPVSFYIAKGIVAVCQTPEDAERAIAENHPHKIIIVTANTTSAWESVMRRSAGVVVEIGSVNSHTGIACREMGIPGITNYAGAKEQLSLYAGKEITLCGSTGRVYLGDFTDAKYIMPLTEIKTNYVVESEDTVPKAKHYAGATGGGQTMETEGKKWIGKPITPTCPLLNEIDRAAHIKVQTHCGLKPADYKTTSNHIFLMDFDDCHHWRTEIRAWEIEQHAQTLEQRKAAEAAFAAASETLVLTAESFDKWFEAYEEKIGYDNIAYPIGEVLTGILHASAKKFDIREPILSDLVTAEIACMGHFEQEICNETLRHIQKELKGTESEKLIIALSQLYKQEDANPEEIRKKEAELITCLHKLHLDDQCKTVATHYRIKEKDFALTVLEDWFQQSKTPWLRLLIESGKLTNPAPQALSDRAKKYYPDNPEIRKHLELAAASKKLHMDGHQTKARGLWKFADKMQELSKKSGIPIAALFKKSKAELKKIVKAVYLKELSEKTGYSIEELTAKDAKEIRNIEAKILLQTEPGTVDRVIPAETERQFSAYEDDKSAALEKRAENIRRFCATLPDAAALQRQGYASSASRHVYPTHSAELSQKLEAFEDGMRDDKTVLGDAQYRGEYVRGDRDKYTQHQLAVPGGRVVTMVHLSQGKPELTVGADQLGRTIAYTSPYKWQNPAVLLDETPLFSEHYDKISRYSKFINDYIHPNFLKHTIDEQLSILKKLEKEYLPSGSKAASLLHRFFQPLNSNERSESLSVLEVIQRLKVELESEQHKLAVTGNPSSIIYGLDDAVPKMQSLVRIPAREQHEQFLNDTLFFVNQWLVKNTKAPISESELFRMEKRELEQFLTDSEIKDKEKFFAAIDAARMFREYERRPKLVGELDGTRVEISMNDSIDIPGQALMMRVIEGDHTKTNRTVNLAEGYASLSAVLEAQQWDSQQSVVLSNLAYTQASSTQSMMHFHVVPNLNSEGQFMVPYLDGMDDQFSTYEATHIDHVRVAYLSEEASADYFNLVKFEIHLTGNKAEDLATFQALDQRLQRFETETGCDMTWVAKFNPANHTVTMCVELRAGINLYSQAQIDALKDRGLWNKIGFTEVMGKKYSMLSQKNCDDAIQIVTDDRFVALKESMLATPLYSLQVGPTGEKTFYTYQDEVPEHLGGYDKEKAEAIIHVARLLQLYDAEQFTKTAAALYHLKPEEMATFKQAFQADAAHEARHML